MTRDIILKRYERGMKPAQIAASEDLELDFVKEVIASSDVSPVKRGRKENQGLLITDDEIIRRLQEGETRYAIEQDFDLTTGTLASRVKRILRDLEEGRQEAKPSPQPKKERALGPQPKVPDERIIELYHEGLTIYGIKKAVGSSHSNIKKRLVRLGLINKEGNQLVAPDASLAAQETAVTLEGEGFSERYTIAQLSKEELDMTDAIAEARNTAKDKWVHYVAHQIDNARIKTKFDVVEQDGKLIKQTEVRFVIEEEMR